ncbi:outer membrane protein assembly factor BamB [Alteromonas aestuariivivens]|uniref:Outer membrane protein assembly factor BamB n=1 Tax=Alteromonas aestuariivivens TaxID=1938339 RepID=A0A3D8MF94_9ALTE|nr:outer membrane protein assembly factor BamB [Alteromonas aestuariivivens]RDV29280.1 outer membrane protein assembly factor BamB [Alteromonas aestuariivivens]
MSLLSRESQGRSSRALGLCLLLTVSLTGCSTVSDWFADDEELEIRRLKPIEAKFEPRVSWDVSVGDGIDDYYSRLRPVFAYDRIFVADRHGEVVALDPESGKTVWEQDFAIFRDTGSLDFISRLWDSGDSARLAGLSAGNNLVFVGTENGLVLALSAENGELVWEARVAGEVLAAPVLDQNILVVNTGAGVLIGLNADTGEQLWSHETDVPPLTLRGISAPSAANGGVLVGTPSGKLQVNITENGLLAWETAITQPAGATELERIVDVDSAPLVYGGIVYVVSYDGSLAAVELRSGRLIWKREYASYRNIALGTNSLFVVDNNSNVYALDRRNGVELWSQGSLKKRALTAAEPVGKYIVVGDHWGYLHWLDQETGEIVAQLELGSDDEDESVYVAPLKVGNDVVAITRDGVVARITVPE